MPALRVVHRQAVIDVAAIVEAAAVAKAVAGDYGVGTIHEWNGQAPAALVEIACGAGIVPRVWHVAAMGQASDAPRFVAGRDEVRDQRLEAPREMAGDRDRPGGCRYRDHAARVLRCGAFTVLMAHLPVLAPSAMDRSAAVGRGPAMRAVEGAMMLGVMILTVMMTLRGLRRH
ncbi:MAG: hypothetical protein ACLP7P_15540 [Rhodomicrobium sp.]